MKKSFFCVDAHTCGMPVRLVVGGAPALKGEAIADKWHHFKSEYDWVRTSLMFEPCGHDAMSGAILYPSNEGECDAALIFIETGGSLPLCGHGTIGAVTSIVEQGLLIPKNPGCLVLETPAGIVRAKYHLRERKVTRVTLSTVASFLFRTAVEVQCPDLGPLKVDIAYGGNFYAIIEPQPGYQGLAHLTADAILKLSPELRKRLNALAAVRHPLNSTISGISHIQWADPFVPARSGQPAYCKNAVFFGERGIDRSPCGTGTSARMAQLVAKGQLEPGVKFVHESFIGSRFEGSVQASDPVGSFPAVKPTVSGTAQVIGLNTIFVDDEDPLHRGFSLY